MDKMTFETDLKVLMELLEWMADPFTVDPHIMDDNGLILIGIMMSKAKESLEIVKRLHN